MGSKIKTFLWAYLVDILTVLIVLLALSAAFQMGRLSVTYSGTSDFSITQHDSR